MCQPSFGRSGITMRMWAPELGGARGLCKRYIGRGRTIHSKNEFRGHGNTYTTDRPVTAGSIYTVFHTATQEIHQPPRVSGSAVKRAWRSWVAWCSRRRVKDEGWSQFAYSMHVCACIHIHTLTLYVSEGKGGKSSESEGALSERERGHTCEGMCASGCARNGPGVRSCIT